jgi:hypothetical protein
MVEKMGDQRCLMFKYLEASRYFASRNNGFD